MPSPSFGKVKFACVTVLQRTLRTAQSFCYASPRAAATHTLPPNASPDLVAPNGKPSTPGEVQVCTVPPIPVNFSFKSTVRALRGQMSAHTNSTGGARVPLPAHDVKAKRTHRMAHIGVHSARRTAKDHHLTPSHSAR